MTERDKSHPLPDWNPLSAEAIRDQRAVYDEMRRRCPVAYSELLGWSLFRHEDVIRVLFDHKTFSSAVSRHLSVPNGMDPPEHAIYRRIIESYFSAKRIQIFEPICRGIASRVVQSFAACREAELIASAALPFAAQAQCAFLGWPAALESLLIKWTHKNQEAIRSQDRKAMSEIALEIGGIVDDLLEARLQAHAGPETDLTTALMHENVQGRPLSNEEAASILRNWTVGEIGTISAAVGILTHYLASHAQLQARLRKEPHLLRLAIDEILRIHGPLVANRRITTRAVEIGGRKIEAGERITLIWISANRDERVFEDPDSFRLDRDPAKNLLYGAGIHICPGAPLARLELRVFIEELLSRTSDITLVPEQAPMLAAYPASGFAMLPLQIRTKG